MDMHRYRCDVSTKRSVAAECCRKSWVREKEKWKCDEVQGLGYLYSTQRVKGAAAIDWLSELVL
jgi:hypothetical protein